MNMPPYFLTYDDCKDMTFAALKEKLSGMEKRAAKDIALGELCAVTNYPNGIYLFYGDNDQLWYVGKATSRSFIERIPSHFDAREEAWFNTLPRKIQAKDGIDYPYAHQKALSLKLVLIGIPCTSPDMQLKIGKLEDAFRHHFGPYLNAKKHAGQKAFDTQIIKDILEP
jgi:hypothetical protein